MAETPEPEAATPEVDAASTPQADAPPEKLDLEKSKDEYIKFEGKQLERFNSVYGALKRLERENAELQRRANQPPPVPQYQPTPVVPVSQPLAYIEPKPKLAQFEDADQWADAVSDWSVRKAVHEARQITRQEFTQEQSQREAQTQQQQLQAHLNTRIQEGYSKFGQYEFDNVCANLAPFTPYGSPIHEAIFGLKHTADVIMELGKNLPEADRISRLHPHDQIYEIKALEKKLVSNRELAAKAVKTTPIQVEQPGTGQEAPAESANFKKLKKEALASDGSIDAFARLFMTEKSASNRR